MSATSTPSVGPIISDFDENACQWFLGAETWIRSTAADTGDGFGLVEQILPVGFESPYHLHHNEDESFYVLEGSVTFISGERSWTAGPRGFAFLPRNIPHGFRVEGNESARVLVLTTPAGFEGFVADLCEPSPPAGPPDLAHVVEVGGQYGIEFLGPLPI